MHLQHDRTGRPKRAAGRIPMERFADEARFIKTLLANPGATGAVTPSGRALARRMARYVDPLVPGLVIELGPGTGPVTQALLRRGIAPERLVLVEFEPKFCRLLERRFPGVRVIQGDAYNLAETLAGLLSEPAAAIVSSLPLLNRPDPDRLKLLKDAFNLMGPQGQFIQFTYGMGSPIPVSKPGEPRLYDLEASAPVWMNIPPARVFAYRALGSSLPRATRPPSKAKRKLPAKDLMSKLRVRAGKVREDFLENAARIEAGLRMHTRLARHQLVRQTRVLRRRADKPAFAMGSAGAGHRQSGRN